MQKFNTQNKGNVLLIVLVVVVLVVLALWWLMKSGYKIPGQFTPTPTPTNAIQDKSDIDSADSQLDSADLNQIDTGVNLILKDSSSF
ncbi:MAG TPA: hypothetical protein VJ227_02080 [Patescibacteria group bacterium]|nr:hypothetical protein [Patescibacteria group bacterium]